MSYTACESIYRVGFVSVLEGLNGKDASAAAAAMKEGGLCVVDIPFDGKNGEAALKEVAKNPDLVAGASGVKTAAQCEKAAELGAKFVLLDGVEAESIALCKEKELCVIPRCRNVADIKEAYNLGQKILHIHYSDFGCDMEELKKIAVVFFDAKFVISLCDDTHMQLCLSAPFTYAVRGAWITPKEELTPAVVAGLTMNAMATYSAVFDFMMYHIGINMENKEAACGVCDLLNDAFMFTPRDNGPSSRFAGIGIEVMKSIYRGAHGHFAVRTNNVDRAILYLKDKGYEMDWSTVYYAGGRIGTIYLKEEHSFGGFAAHLLQKVF